MCTQEDMSSDSQDACRKSGMPALAPVIPINVVGVEAGEWIGLATARLAPGSVTNPVSGK